MHSSRHAYRVGGYNDLAYQKLRLKGNEVLTESPFIEPLQGSFDKHEHERDCRPAYWSYEVPSSVQFPGGARVATNQS